MFFRFSGNNKTDGCSARSLFHGIDGRNIDTPENFIDVDHDRKGNGCLGSGKNDDEQTEHHTLHAPVELRESQKIDIGGIEYQFDSHENHNGVLAGHDGKKPETKKKSRYGQKMIETDVRDQFHETDCLLFVITDFIIPGKKCRPDQDCKQQNRSHLEWQNITRHGFDTNAFDNAAVKLNIGRLPCTGSVKGEEQSPNGRQKQQRTRNHVEHVAFQISLHDTVGEHHTEKQKHEYAADVNDYLGHRNEIRTEKYIKSGYAEKAARRLSKSHFLKTQRMPQKKP